MNRKLSLALAAQKKSKKKKEKTSKQRERTSAFVKRSTGERHRTASPTSNARRTLNTTVEKKEGKW